MDNQIKKDIQVASYQKKEVEKWIPDIAKLRIEVFAEYPFLYLGDPGYEMRYLHKFTTSQDAVVVVATKNGQIIGAATGLPLASESEELKSSFIQAGLHIEDYFYFGESVLKKQYRGIGIGHLFFDQREKHVQKLNRFKYICFCTVHRPANDPRRPPEYRALKDFWEKRGYKEHPELAAYISWQEIDEKKETPKKMIFWIKKI